MASILSRRILLVLVLAMSTLIGECTLRWGPDAPDDDTILKENHEQTGSYPFLASYNLHLA